MQCNPITKLPVLQIFGLQYLDRHLHRLRMPKNLKISKSTKTGPISNISPKTSRAARDRPEQNPRRNQPSRHRRSGGRWQRTTARQARRTAARNVARTSRGQRASSVDQQASSGATSGRPPRNIIAQTCTKRRTAIAHDCAGQLDRRPANGRDPGAVAGAMSNFIRFDSEIQRKRHFTVGGGRYRQSGPRPDSRLLRQHALKGLTRSARMDSPRQIWPEQIPAKRRWRRAPTACIDGGGGVRFEEMGRRLLLRPWAHNHCGSGISTHDPLGITDSACKNQLVVVSVQYCPFNPYIPIRSTTIGKSRVAIDPIAMSTSWRSNSDIASVTSIGYPRMSASGESSTTMHRILHASGSHPIPPPDDPKTNQYNQDLGLIHSTNGNYLESPKEGSSIDHQVWGQKTFRFPYQTDGSGLQISTVVPFQLTGLGFS
ncbi:lysosomal Pro-X carboxypeptidase-like [Dorcoceras hygrometricum]|uniref:Lysosomal Pro-X carboxypeptidase-like n=1 Tax=Dorcoceras hygrometricum TaxID=472368 RepID=A0A2Z7ARH4_9LAMI|nr:lysosomal Pro-X carboxypeptidase-like [Dorcoceras hygrometricum]